MEERLAPSSGEPLPVIGCGTWLGFDVGARPCEKPRRAEVLQALLAAGGRVIVSSPMYGTAEEVVGELLPGLPDAESGAADSGPLPEPGYWADKLDGIVG